MKKLVMSILTILTCGAAHALPVGNPSEPSLFTNGLWWDSCGCCDFCDPCFNWCDAWSFRIGYYGDFVFNHHLSTHRHDGADGRKNLEHVEMSTNAGYIALNFCNRIDVFTTLGQTSVHTRQNTTLLNAAPTIRDHESDFWFSPTFSWSIGARAALWQCDCFTLGIEGQYFRFNPDVDHLVTHGPLFNGLKTYFGGNAEHFHTNYKEWQIGLGVSYRIATSCPTLAFVPYAAVKYSRVHWDIDKTFTVATGTTPLATLNLPDLRTPKHWGWALGLSFTMCDLAGVTVEGRFANEKALYVNGQVRF